MRVIAAGLTLALALLAFAACAGGSDEETLTVFAASSLTEAFKEAAAAFESDHPGINVRFNFAASSALATQINERAPADVFASADSAQMQAAAAAVDEPAVFARNLPVVVVPKDSPLQRFDELATPGLRLVLASPEVPIGRYSREILSRASDPAQGIAPDFSDRVLANLKSEEANVRAVLTKVQLGEAEAGIIYRTDASTAASDVRAIDIPPRYNVVAEYPVAVVTGSEHRQAAEAFVAFLRSPRGIAILERFGFMQP